MDDTELIAMDNTRQSSRPDPTHLPTTRVGNRWRSFLNHFLYPLLCLFALFPNQRPPTTPTVATPNPAATTSITTSYDSSHPIQPGQRTRSDIELTSDSTPTNLAFACKICGRRFGVQSNLNRHERKCIQKPVHNKQVASASATSPGSSATVGENVASASPVADTSRLANARPDSAGTSSSTSADAVAETTGKMAREKTNPAHRQGRGSVSSQQQALRRSRSEPQPGTSDTQVARPDTQGTTAGSSGLELTHVSTNASASASSGQSSAASGSSGASVATITTTATTPGPEGERRPKRRRRAPSPSRWVPASLSGFSLAPCRDSVQTPLPPVRPHVEEGTGFYEERDSFAVPPPGDEGDDENVDPTYPASSSSSGSVGSSGSGNNSPTSGINSAIGAGLSMRQRNFEYAPYHPCGWIGRLPGPAVDITNYHHVSIGAAGPSGSTRGGGGGGSGFTYEFALSASV